MAVLVSTGRTGPRVFPFPVQDGVGKKSACPIAWHSQRSAVVLFFRWCRGMLTVGELHGAKTYSRKWIGDAGLGSYR